MTHCIRCLLFLQCLALTACFGTTPPAPLPEELSPLVLFMASAEAGESQQLDDPAFGNDVSVTQEDTFTSASGEDCRRATVIANRREAEMIVICRSGAGPWKMAPRIWGSGQ